jgi:transposase InsO family protein
LYLAVLIDLYSRRVVGWAMSDRIDTELALGALRMAGTTRALAANWIHHTDRDCRYGSDDYLAVLKAFGARPSMSRKGDCWDNAVSESFFATLEKELLALQPLQSRSKTRQDVADYIDNYYNLVRPLPRRRSRSRQPLRRPRDVGNARPWSPSTGAISGEPTESRDDGTMVLR